MTNRLSDTDYRLKCLTKAQHYRERARGCEGRADEVQTAEAKHRFLRLAQLWKSLAEQSEREGM